MSKNGDHNISKTDDYNAVMARKAEIMLKSTGIDYTKFESGSVAFDYEKMMRETGYSLEEIQKIQYRVNVGNTPVLELKNLTALARRCARKGKGARIFIKDEAANPSGSFKARRAATAVYHAKKLGYKGVIAATSGNYGAAVASQAAIAGLSCIVVQECYDSRGVGQPEIIEKARKCEWNLLLQTAKSSLMNTTIMPASGNHDSGNSTFIDHFNLDIPRSTATTGAYYSVDYGNAHFVVLNTNESSGNYKEFTNVQVDWLKSDIESAKNAGAQWIIVVMHMGPYTIAEHSSDSNVKDTRAKIAPLFNELGVDLVLQGHDHVYERSKPIVNGAAVGKTTVMGLLNSRPFEYIIDPKGPIYLTPGTAGTKHYYQNPGLSKDYLNLFDVASGPYKGDLDIENQETFMGITVDGDTLTATAYQISKTKNGGEPYIIDQFGIKKKV